MLRNISYNIVGATLTLGLLFKYAHWPGAREILFASLVGMAIVLLEYAFLKRKPKLFTRNVVNPLLGVVFVFGVLFKAMSLPFGDPLMIVSMIGIAVAFTEYAYSIRNSVLVIIPTMLAVAMVVILFTIIHWPLPSNALHIVEFSYTILVPVLLLVRWYKLKQAAPSLSKYLAAIAVLSLITDLVYYYLTYYSGESGLALHMPSIVYVIVLSAFLLVIKKALQLGNVSSQFQKDFGLLQCIGAIGIIALTLQVLVS